MTDIFQPTDESTTIPDNPLEVLVGEGKKFKTVEELARGKLESDNFIGQLQREMNELREAVGKHQSMEEIKTQILSSLKREDPPIQPPVTPPENENIDSANIETLVSQLLQKREAEKIASTNKEKVTQTLQEKFGADASLILNQKARELNVTLDYLAKVANDSPTAFFRLVGVDVTATPSQTPPAPLGTVTPLPRVQSGTDWERMKATNPKEYFSQENTMKRYREQMRSAGHKA